MTVVCVYFGAGSRDFRDDFYLVLSELKIRSVLFENAAFLFEALDDEFGGAEFEAEGLGD